MADEPESVQIGTDDPAPEPAPASLEPAPAGAAEEEAPTPQADPVAVLAALEAPKHARDMAGVMVGRLRYLKHLNVPGHEVTDEQIAAAEAHHEAMKAAHAEHMAKLDPNEIDRAAQAVIDARGEGE